MIYYFDGIIVVEGKSDEAFLSSFIKCIYVKTNGYDIPDQEIDFLNSAKGKRIIILTDSDEAGKAIREKVNQQVNNVINLSVDLSRCDKNSKHGVAECDKDEVLNILKEYLVTKENKNTKDVRINHEIKARNDKYLNDYLAKIFHLGKCNSKQLVKRIEFLNISYEEVSKAVNDFYGNK